MRASRGGDELLLAWDKHNVGHGFAGVLTHVDGVAVWVATSEIGGHAVLWRTIQASRRAKQR